MIFQLGAICLDCAFKVFQNEGIPEDEGKYRHAQEILNKLVYAEPQNQVAKDLLADTFEQLGYQYESPSVRNSFLAAAYELRNGLPKGESPKSTGPDMIRAMDTRLFLDFLGVRLDSAKADGIEFKVNFITPDNDEKFAIELSNNTLTNIEGFLHKNPDMTLTVNREDLNDIMVGSVTFDEMIQSGKAKIEGDGSIFETLKSLLVQFDMLFEIMPGTLNNPPSGKDLGKFEQEFHKIHE